MSKLTLENANKPIPVPLTIDCETIIAGYVVGLAMPVVTIETNRQLPARDIGVREMSTKPYLLLVRDMQQVKDCITLIFESVNAVIFSGAVIRTVYQVIRAFGSKFLATGGAFFSNLSISLMGKCSVMALYGTMQLFSIGSVKHLSAIRAGLLNWWNFIRFTETLHRAVIRGIGTIVVSLAFKLFTTYSTSTGYAGSLFARSAQGGKPTRFTTEAVMPFNIMVGFKRLAAILADHRLLRHEKSLSTVQLVCCLGKHRRQKGFESIITLYTVFA